MEKGEGAGVVLLPPARVQGLPPEKFSQTSIENMRFKGHVYADFMYFFKTFFHIGHTHIVQWMHYTVIYHLM